MVAVERSESGRLRSSGKSVGSNASLAEAISQAKEEIARLAGVESDNIRVIIEI